MSEALSEAITAAKHRQRVKNINKQIYNSMTSNNTIPSLDDAFNRPMTDNSKMTYPRYETYEMMECRGRRDEAVQDLEILLDAQEAALKAFDDNPNIETTRALIDATRAVKDMRVKAKGLEHKLEYLHTQRINDVGTFDRSSVTYSPAGDAYISYNSTQTHYTPLQTKDRDPLKDAD